MPTNPLDRDFQDFQRTRDPAALARVFDAAAPRLLLVAMHLCRDAAAAEDLVQTVFLQVLRDVDQFDARRPVLPWLLGMLEHRARDLRQRAHVRRERVGAVGDDVAAGERSPQQVAAANEVRQRVAEALQGMPGDYRDVLTLRLVHGLAAVEIAHAHGLPPATVRTRLRRGLELLRGALPRGLATSGLMLLLAGELLRARDGFAAVRAKVLAAAGGGGVAIGAGWWFAIVAGLALLVGGGAYWFADRLPPLPMRAAAGPEVAVAIADESETKQPTVVGAPDRELVSPPSTDARRSIVHGRVLDAATGAPLVGAKVTLHTFAVDRGGAPPADWRDPEPVVTAVDGCFEFGFVPVPQLSLQIDFTADGHVKEWRSFDALREGVTVEVGDVSMARGTPVHLRLERGGRPLVGVTGCCGRKLDGRIPTSQDGFGPSDAAGCVDLGNLLPGDWHFEVDTHLLGHESDCEIPLQDDVFEYRPPLRESARDRSISGVLVDQSGRPVPGVELGIKKAPGYLVDTTDGDGHFLWTFVPTPANQDPYRIELFGLRPDLQWLDDGGEIALGSHDLRLVVRRRATAALRFEVTEATTGKPVPAFGVSCWLDGRTLGSHSLGRFQRAPCEPHADGTALLRDLVAGPCFASVFPPAPYAEQAEIAVTLVEGQTTTLAVRLSPPAELLVDVIDEASGLPAPGIDVALVKVVPTSALENTTMTSYRVDLEVARRRGPTSSGPDRLVLVRGRSDEHGQVRLLAPPDAPGLVLFAEGPLCTGSIRRDIQLPVGGAHTSIAVTRAAQVRGVVRPREFVTRFGPSPEDLRAAAEKAKTQLTDPDQFAGDHGEVELHPLGAAGASELTANLDADGNFAVGAVPNGRYEVWLRPYRADSIGPLMTIDVDFRATNDPIVLDVAPFLPVRATLRVFVDGTPFVGEVGLARLVGVGRLDISLPRDSSGLGHSPWLLPGTYVPFANVADANGETRAIFGDERFELTAGKDADLVATLHHRAVTITVVDAAGAACGNTWLRVEAIDRPETQSGLHTMRTHTEGRVVIDPAPIGRLRCDTFATGQGLDDEPALPLGEIAATATTARFVRPATAR